MNVNQLIEQLQVLKQNLEKKGKTEVLIVEHGFSMGAVQTYVRRLNNTEIQFYSDIEITQPVFTESDDIKDGIVIGFIPRYEKKED